MRIQRKTLLSAFLILSSGCPAASVKSLPPASISASPLTLLFPATATGTKIERAVTLSNGGQVPISIRSPALEGDKAFSVVPLSDLAISAGATLSISVIYAPTVVGQQTAQLIINSDANNGTLTIPLTGSAVAPPRDPCSGVHCDQTPNSICSDAKTLTTYVGSCSDGQCNYPAQNSSCPERCAAGACVSNSPNKATGLTLGQGFACALTGEKRVKCWGLNGVGQLGDGTTTDRYHPVDVSGLSGVSAISAGSNHTCALLDGGGVKCWGDNFFGQLGNGSKGDRQSSPVDVLDLAGVAAITSAGLDYTCALLQGGGVKCWGDGFSYTTAALTPVDIAGLASGATQIETDAQHACALTSAGGVKCWGNDGNGQLGDGNPDPTRSRAVALDAAGLSQGTRSVAVGDFYHTCAVTAGETVRCWGFNSHGQVGDNTLAERHTPVDVVGITDALSVSLGGQDSCAVTKSGGVKCWGSNVNGQLGDGTTSDRLAAVDVMGLTSSVGAVFANLPCALTTRGGLVCWGGSYGPSPVDVPGLSSGVITVARGNERLASACCRREGSFTCALTDGGGIFCWGDNFQGQLGNGTTDSSSTPGAVNW